MAFINSLSTSYLSILNTSLSTGAALDEFGQDALFGYSLLSVKDDATVCVRVRRDSDNTQQDIGFNGSDEIDSSALELFAEGSQCFVVIWYNQLGGTIHLAQPTPSLQPAITDGSGVTLADTTNGKAYMDFSATSYFDFTETEGTYTSSTGWSVLAQSLTGDYGIYFLGNSKRTTGFGEILSADSNNDRVELYDSKIQYYVNGTSDTSVLSNDGFDNLYLWEISRNNTDGIILYRNDNQSMTGSVTSSGSFELERVGEGFDGDVFAMFVYSVEPSSQRTSFFLNLNDYYNMVTFASPTISGVPVISGVIEVGEVITATVASSSGYPIPTDSLQWQVSNDGTTGWTDIAGETSTTYTIDSLDANKYLRVKQTSTNTQGSDTVASVSTTIVLDMDFSTTEWQIITSPTWEAITDNWN